MSMKKEFRKILNEKGRTELPRVLLVSAECAPISKIKVSLGQQVGSPSQRFGWFNE